MKSIYRFSIVVFGILLLFLYTSCKKFVEIPPAPNLIVSDQVFSDSADANAAVLGMYTNMVGPNSTSLGAYNGAISIYTGLSSDELYSTRGIANENAIYANAVLPTNNIIPVFWSGGTGSYSIIYKANAIIEGLSKSATISTTVKNQLIGEAKVVRAFCYFNLINLYGAVPLITSTDYNVNAVLPRTSVDSIYQQITTDLTSAQSLLPVSYPSIGKARPNRFTAEALLARVYLYQRKWTEAETVSSDIINSGVYSLESNLNNVFLAGKNESIWEVIPTQSGYETAEGFFFIPTSTTVKPKYVISNSLLNAFEPGDERKVVGNWLKVNTVSGITYYYPTKYKLGRDNNTTPLENYVVFRLAEQYLIRAEAMAQQNKLTDAASDLNKIRNRAGLANTTATTQTDLLTAIYHERRVELFCEWGHRWFDLKRTGQVDAVMSIVAPQKGGIWNTNWQLYPIALSELQANPYLIQNPGY